MAGNWYVHSGIFIVISQVLRPGLCCAVHTVYWLTVLSLGLVLIKMKWLLVAFVAVNKIIGFVESGFRLDQIRMA